MNDQQKLAVFRAQVTNVRSLESGIRQIRRSINFGLKRRDDPYVAAHTRLYGITFCAWAEANFSKVIHTPYGFTTDEIVQIQKQKQNGISGAWKKAVQLGLRYLTAKSGNFRPNAQRKLEQAIDRHVFEPSLLRNKLAHGQWAVALNRTNDAIEPVMTGQVRSLSITEIDGWLTCHRELAHLVETLIESPKRAFYRDWYGIVARLEERMEEAERRSLADHVAKLRRKATAAGQNHRYFGDL
jgi:hypothetical protein